MGWTNPVVLAELIGGALLLVLFCLIETRVEDPMFHLDLFKIRAFTCRQHLELPVLDRARRPAVHAHHLAAGDLAAAARLQLRADAAVGRASTCCPLTAGFLVAALSGRLSDRYGARPFATGGMLIGALSFALLMLLPANFTYLPFAGLLLLLGVGMGLFAAPNTSSIMSSVPERSAGRGVGHDRHVPQHRHGAVDRRVLLADGARPGQRPAPHACTPGLTANGVPSADATRLSHLPPVGTLFAAFLGYNPIKTLLGPQVLGGLPPARVAYLTGRSFFPGLISHAFITGLRITFMTSIVMFLVAALASWMRGGHLRHGDQGRRAATGSGAPGRG